LIAIAAAQDAPASARLPEAASASAASTKAIIHASLCPPPAKWSASSGFQPTKAAAKAGRGERRAVRRTSATIAKAASALYVQAAAAADSPTAAAWPSEASVKPGP
jgi:hypothetical protein